MESRLAELCHSMQTSALHRRHRVTVICRDNPELPLDSSGVCLYLLEECVICRDNPELPLDYSGVCLYLLEECGEWRIDWRSYVTQCRQQRYTVDIVSQ
ncbi:hypothetical protein J6590_081757 [Homalodisca vitripennis]|nr:hypothetical protein J6590_081757 [Homalodisca vitripennis]